MRCPTLPPLTGPAAAPGPQTFVQSLSRLDLSGDKRRDFSELREHLGLTELSLRSSGIVTLAALAGLRSLRALDLGSTTVSDLRPLATLYDLEELDISGTRVTDLAPLSQLGRLRILRLRNTPVSDISVVRHLFSLELIEIKGCPIESLSPLKTFGSQLRVLLDQALVDRVRRRERERADRGSAAKPIGRSGPESKLK